METKFLSDGRKVAIIGQLNNQEAIVQEVFITEQGDEIPSGERFTAKSLHDAPVKSYKAKEEERLEKRIREKEAEIDKLKKRARSAHIDAKTHEDIGKFVRKAASNMEPADLATLTAFLSGDIQWLVSDNYGFEPPARFGDSLKDIDSWGGVTNYGGLKLLSLYGNTDGSLAYRINRYGDGSGSSTEVFGFSTFEEAARKSIELAMARLEKTMNASGMAAEILRSSVAEHLTDDERKTLRGAIENAIENANASYRKQAAELAERSSKSVDELKALLSDS